MSYRKPFAELNTNTPIIKQQLTRESAARAQEIARQMALLQRLEEQARQAGILERRFLGVPPPPPPPAMKTGGLIKSTGVYTLHKGEVVVPASRVKSVDMSLKKDKKKPLKK